MMIARFEKDSIIALATAENGIPYVRYVNAYYQNKNFYIITHGLSNKMKQIEKNPVAISGDWFSANGIGINLGYFYKEKNTEIADRLKTAFAAWIENGHNDFNDMNTCILCVKLRDGVLFSHGKHYHIDFTG